VRRRRGVRRVCHLDLTRHAERAQTPSLQINLNIRVRVNDRTISNSDVQPQGLLGLPLEKQADRAGVRGLGGRLKAAHGIMLNICVRDRIRLLT
jgi:hypothetical protein